MIKIKLNAYSSKYMRRNLLKIMFQCLFQLYILDDRIAKKIKKQEQKKKKFYHLSKENE